MSVLLDLGSPHIQEGHVDELTLQLSLVGLLHSVWVALNTVEYVAGHELTSGVTTMPLIATIQIIMDTKALMVPMWMVCL